MFELRIGLVLAAASVLACHDLDYAFGPEGARVPEFQVSVAILGWPDADSRRALYDWVPGRASRLTVVQLGETDLEEDVVVWDIVAATHQGIASGVWHGHPPPTATVMVTGDPRLLTPDGARYRVTVTGLTTGVTASAEFEI